MENSEAKDKKTTSSSIVTPLGGRGDGEVAFQGGTDVSGNYKETSIKITPVEDNNTTHIFNSKIREMSEKDIDSKNVRFEYLVKMMSDKIRSEKYGRNTITYQVTDELDVLADLNPAEERAIIAAAREKIAEEDKEAQKEREQRQQDAHRRLMNSREFCQWCHQKTGWAHDSMSRHLRGCTLYQKHVLQEAEDQKLHDNYLTKFEYLFERLSSLTYEMSEIKKFMNSLRFVEANANLDKNTPILQAAQEIKMRIMQEKEKRFKVIKELDNFADTYESFLDKYLNTESTTTSELEEQNKEIVSAASSENNKKEKSVQR